MNGVPQEPIAVPPVTSDPLGYLPVNHPIDNPDWECGTEDSSPSLAKQGWERDDLPPLKAVSGLNYRPRTDLEFAEGWSSVSFVAIPCSHVKGHPFLHLGNYLIVPLDNLLTRKDQI